MRNPQSNHENIFHERISLLHKNGYRGFTVTNIRRHWQGVHVTARNSSGRTVFAEGETKEEAYSGLISQIDRALES